MKESEEQRGGEVERVVQPQVRVQIENLIRETTFARVNTRLVTHVVLRYPTKRGVWLKEWYNLRLEVRSTHIRETTFA